MAGWLDATIGESMLALYRSAVEIPRGWTSPVDDIHAPGLAIMPGADPWAQEGLGRRVATRAGAQIADLEGLGHWWMLEDPRLAAQVLESFWSAPSSPRSVARRTQRAGRH